MNIIITSTVRYYTTNVRMASGENWVNKESPYLHMQIMEGGGYLLYHCTNTHQLQNWLPLQA